MIYEDELLKVTEQELDTMKALLDANPAWKAVSTRDDRFNQDLLMITQVITKIMNRKSAP